MTTYRPALSALALLSVFALTGAKGEGCGGSYEPEPEPGPCGTGAHLETICLMECYESSEPGGEGGCTETCAPTCVPDDDCPPGTFAAVICDEPISSSSDSAGAPCLGDDCAEPPQEGCRTECVPVDTCPAGYDEQWVCDDTLSGPNEEPAAPADCLEGDCAEPPPPEDCWLQCVPVDDPCGPGMHEEWVCEPLPAPSGADEEPVPPPEDCYAVCVPDGDCPPGSPVIEVCTDDGQGGLDCWTECDDTEPPAEAS